MASKKIPVLVLVATVMLALSLGNLSAFDGTRPLISEEPTVTPLEGKYTDWFNYTLVLEFYENATIKLEIEKVGGWEEIATREYNKSPYAQTLFWNVTPFSAADVGMKPYRFKWGDIALYFEGDLIFVGPTIITEPIYEFKNETVTPPSGYYDTSFAYSVEFKSNKNQSITLEVYNFSSSKWEPHETRRSTNSGNPLNWPGISHLTNSSYSKDVLGKYRFFFMDHGERYESNLFRDPLLLPTTPVAPPTPTLFKNATVSPSRGNFSTAFDYTVEVNNRGIEINNVTLEVYNGSWRHKGSGTNKSSGGNKWEWKDISFGEGYEGVAKYKFLCNNKYESAVYDGPLLLNETPQTVIISGGGGGGGGSSYKPYMQYENAIVEPNDWTIKGAIESKTFYYSVEVDKKDMMILEIYNPSNNEWEEQGKGNESKLKGAWGNWRHEWNVTLTLDKNWAGYGKYRFYPEKKEKYASQVYYGPEIKMPSYSEWFSDIGFSDTILKVPEINCTLNYEDGMWFKQFTYTADITHPDRANMTAVLFVYKPGSDGWEPVPWRKDRFNPIINSSMYNKTTNTTTVRWTIEKTEVFDEKDGEEKSEGGKKSKYYIWYWDGYTEYKKSQGYFYGPKLYVNHKPQLRGDPKIDPDPGSTHTTYTYKFGVNDTDGDPVCGYLTITDPLDVDHIVEGVSREGNLTFRVGPNLGFFTKLQENVESFTSRYRLEYQDEGMAINGSMNKAPPDGGWFTGPTVKLVDVRNVTKPNASPENGTYADEYTYSIKFYSSEENTLDLTLTIYDPSNSKDPDVHYGRLNISARRPASFDWKIKPDVFGPDDFDKTANFTITYNDSYTNRGKRLNGSGPYIQRAVPLSSLDWPLMPIVSMVAVPALVFLYALLAVLLNVWGKFKGILKLMKGIQGIQGGEQGEKGEGKGE